MRFFNFLSGHERSVKAKKNIIGLFALKGYSIVITLFLLPFTLFLLDDYKYGVWITIFNILSWIQIFDIGIGNGLRNKFAEAIASNNIIEAKEYVSTAYFLMSGLSILLIVLFILPWNYINWATVFNVEKSLSNEISILIGIAFSFTAFQFTLKLIDTLLMASHLPVLSSLILSISNSLILLIFFLLKNQITGSLILIGTIYTLVPVVVLIFANLFYFNNRFRLIKPGKKYFKKGKIKELFNLGIHFFLIQLAVLIIFQTDTIIIAHVLSPQEVTSYNIVFRYFGIVTMLTTIVMTPFWSAYTEAITERDFKWIKKTVIKQVKAMVIVVFLIVLLLTLAKTLIPIWLQKNIDISIILLIGMSIYTFISVWNNIFAFLLNGLSVTKLQMIISVFASIINIPLSILLAKNLGNGGVILATIISLSLFAVAGPIQSFQIITRWKMN